MLVFSGWSIKKGLHHAFIYHQCQTFFLIFIRYFGFYMSLLAFLKLTFVYFEVG